MRTTKEIRKEIIKLYSVENKSLSEIGRIFNMSGNWIKYIIKKEGIKIRPAFIYRIRYQCNDNFFEKMDTPEKAQILGLLYADGYNSEKLHRLIVILAEDSFDYLAHINNTLGSTRKLSKIYINQKYPNRQDCYKLDIYSPKISKDLKKLGCFQNKSLTLKFPTNEQVSNNLIVHFIRGYFEGDGAITIDKKKNNYYFCISSTLEFCLSLKEIISKNIGINANISKDHIERKSNNYKFTIGGNLQVIKILNWIYKDSPFYLKRKYERYQALKNLYFKNGQFVGRYPKKAKRMGII